jgi:hypothetical protein
MIRLVLLTVLAVLVVRALWRLIGGVVAGVSDQSGRALHHGIHMVRDPVCGTFVLPDRAITMAEGGASLHFCSATCRDKYRARTA